VVDAAGKFLIPGLWDMHVHTLHQSFLDLYLANGVTGVRDMGNFPDWSLRLRKETAEGKLLGPRMMIAGPILDGPGPVWPFYSLAVADAAAGREAVRSVKRRGMDFVKVYSLLDRDAYFAIAAECKQQGISFAGHVPFSVGAAEASDAGQKSIEHLDGVLEACSPREAELRKEALAQTRHNPNDLLYAMDRSFARALEDPSEERAAALFARFVKNGTWQCPTLTVLRVSGFVDDRAFTADERLKYVPRFLRVLWAPQTNPFLKRYPPEEVRRARRNFPKYLERVGAMRRAGVEFLAGTDAGCMYCFPGFSLHDELELLVRAGLTPLEALQAATRNPARYFGRLKELGTVEPGKLADLVLLDADPLADIRNTRKIAAVVVGGRLLPRDALHKMLDEVEAAVK
jgi:imidazolonepropionase-like amidohydrolase